MKFTVENIDVNTSYSIKDLKLVMSHVSLQKMREEEKAIDELICEITLSNCANSIPGKFLYDRLREFYPYQNYHPPVTLSYTERSKRLFESFINHVNNLALYKSGQTYPITKD